MPFAHDPTRLLLIAGPCSLETEALSLRVAGALSRLASVHPELQIVFKGSFDKANRTSPTSPRGPGLEEGLRIHRRVAAEFGFPCTTDVHSPEQAAPVAEACEVLQIPAFLCRQTDLLLAAGATGKVVNVKKGQFLAPEDMRYAVDKATAGGARAVWQTERGSTFGYRDLVVDFRSLALMGAHGRPVIFDATHSVQRPGASGGSTAATPEHIPALARAALAAGADGLFIETHPEPARALSDPQSQWPLEHLPALIESCLRVWRATRS